MGAPNSGVVLDASGNLYGATIYGGSGYGTIFEVSSTGVFTILYSFTGGTDGKNP
ncbi:MAG TPA: choice-of-anchor tandem repeat GloVer-containing protein [Bryobacteraceae bacterium]|nr:choice-of-anchor tandem repeat GloVer-containing protein [Bryobacteraceae bacterium]